MKEDGRSVVPWFSTCIAAAFFTAVVTSMIAKLMIGSTTTDFAMSAFLIGIIAVGLLSFFGVKAYLFNNERNIKISQVYIDTYTNRQRSFFSSIVVTVIIITPFILMFLVWLTDKPLPN
ncbi:hypothetical protein EWM62_14795 [Mucilaginibacter terrigena]|uniref:Uncharacterized protein n=1 Tax=Mucilaginibacter terrigena TaxID=2492395 RepID=A0A4Q5LJH1_9SPHI|nr:hypothetical protein [Mucilaginibacter terrigena]RYU89581.1 hypothetical protein EWM62_14795 [Mucilaginibacter terrigena]